MNSENDKRERKPCEMTLRENRSMKASTYLGWLLGLLLSIPLSYTNAQRGPALSEESQMASDHHPWWISVGGGPSLIGESFGLAAGMVYSYQFKNSLISGRIFGMTNVNPTVQKIDPSTTKYRIADYGILYGPIWHYGHSFLSLGAGVGLVRAAREYAAVPSTSTSISLPLEAQWFWQPTKFAGFGIYAYASLNFEKQLCGVLLCAQLGRW
jgi:hypothetical protein